MVDGTPTGTIEKWLNATYELRSFGKARPFSTKEQSTEKTSVLCSQLDCHRGRNGVKGQDERRTTAPLTPSRPLPESFCLRSRKSDLTEADVVIHGLSSVVPAGLNLQFADPHTLSNAVIHSILYDPTKVVPGYKAEFFIRLLAGTQLGSSDHGGMGEVFYRGRPVSPDIPGPVGGAYRSFPDTQFQYRTREIPLPAPL
ncbi:MAG: hypothetical protein QOE55_728 [Acidobacteriaceae bacterium]|nr:hypothetical protein [Acidobacteriaceae bacterium]